MKNLAFPLLVVILTLGCVPPSPSPEPAPDPKPAPVEPFKATARYVDLVKKAWENTGNDNPTPQPTDECQNCGGKGWTGDGVTKLTCNACGGSGKLTKATQQVAAEQGSDNRCDDPNCPCGPVCLCGDNCKCSVLKQDKQAAETPDGKTIWVKQGGVDSGKWTIGATGVDDTGQEWVLEAEGWRPVNGDPQNEPPKQESPPEP